MPTCTKWDQRYLDLAKQISTWSKDPSTKCGAVIIGDMGQVISQGFNGFPRGISDPSEIYNDRPTKYRYIVHAEMNAIYNAASYGISLRDSTLYVYGLPCCHECAKGIIQTGIRKVVMIASSRDDWKDSCSLAGQLFAEANVQTLVISDEEYEEVKRLGV